MANAKHLTAYNAKSCNLYAMLHMGLWIYVENN